MHSVKHSPSTSISCTQSMPHVERVSLLTSCDSEHGYSESGGSRTLHDVHIVRINAFIFLFLFFVCAVSLALYSVPYLKTDMNFPCERSEFHMLP